MIDGFRPAPSKTASEPPSGLVAIPANVWTIEAGHPAYFDWLTPQPPTVETAISSGQLLLLFLVILSVHALIVLFADILYPKLAQQFTQPVAGQ